MALKGNLKDFNLADIFQLITLSKKKGALVIESSEGKGSIYFKDGGIYFASTPWSEKSWLQKLLTSQKVSNEERERILKDKEKDTSKKVGTALVEKGIFSLEELQSFLVNQIADAIFDLFTWKEGDFNFEGDQERDDEDLGIVADSSKVISEVNARLDEWKKIKKIIPSLKMYFKISSSPGEGDKDISLKPKEWKVISGLDGRKDISTVSKEVGLSEFETCKILSDVYSKGLIEVAEPPVAEVVEKEKKEEVISLEEVREEKKEEVIEEKKEEVKEGLPVEEIKPEEAERKEAVAEEIKKKADQVVEEITAKITEQILGAKKEKVKGGKPKVDVEVESKGEVPVEELEEMLEELTSLTEVAPPESSSELEEATKVEEEGTSLDKGITRELVLKIIKGIKRL